VVTSVSLVLVTTILAACDATGDDGLASDPVRVSSTATESSTDAPVGTVSGGSGAGSDVVRPVGFERVAATITAADGNRCEVCLWLAETGDQRSRGLMGVTEVGDSDGTADGMAFVYPQPHTGTFWMKNTLLPLSIAFFGHSGDYLSSFDMEPCAADPCPNYPTPADFTVAIEVPRGNLPALMIGAGSTLELTNLPCPRNRPG
jgi:uncharacterized membrane protein (UPF0127 family)